MSWDRESAAEARKTQQMPSRGLWFTIDTTGGQAEAYGLTCMVCNK